MSTFKDIVEAMLEPETREPKLYLPEDSFFYFANLFDPTNPTDSDDSSLFNPTDNDDIWNPEYDLDDYEEEIDFNYYITGNYTFSERNRGEAEREYFSELVASRIKATRQRKQQKIRKIDDKWISHFLRNSPRPEQKPRNKKPSGHSRIPVRDVIAVLETSAESALDQYLEEVSKFDQSNEEDFIASLNDPELEFFLEDLKEEEDEEAYSSCLECGEKVYPCHNPICKRCRDAHSAYVCKFCGHVTEEKATHNGLCDECFMREFTFEVEAWAFWQRYFTDEVA